MRPALALSLCFLLAAACSEPVKLPTPKGGAVKLPKTGFPLAPLDRTLAAVVDDKGRVDYARLRAHRGDLERFLNQAAQTSPRSEPGRFRGRSHAAAYWINVYLAATLFGVTERPQLKSLEGEQRDFYYFSRYPIGGAQLSLFEMEEALFRLYPHDLRLRGLTYCASVDCPPLPRAAIRPDDIKAALKAAGGYLCGPKNVQPEEAAGGRRRLLLNPIFQWFGRDVEEAGGAVKFCRAHGRPELREDAELRYRTFDWRINSQP